MINLDPIIYDWISGNWLAIGLALGILRGIAKITPWSHDDSIVQMLTGLFTQIRGGGKKQ